MNQQNATKINNARTGFLWADDNQQRYRRIF